MTQTSPNPSLAWGTTVPPAAQRGPAPPAIAHQHTSFPSQQPPLKGTAGFWNSRQDKAKKTSLSARYRHPLLPREAQGGNKLILHLPHHSKAQEAAAVCSRASHSNQHPSQELKVPPRPAAFQTLCHRGGTGEKSHPLTEGICLNKNNIRTKCLKPSKTLSA